MINYTFVYDLSKKRSTVFKPERKESDYKELVEMFISSVLKDPTLNKRNHLRFFDTDELGFCVLNGETALGVITTKLGNEHQKRIIIEFITTVNARLTGNSKPKTSREARTFLKATIAEYTKKLNLAKMFPERMSVGSKQLESDVASWFAMEAEASKQLIRCKKERHSAKFLGVLPNTWGLLGGVFLILVILFLWVYMHFF